MQAKHLRLAARILLIATLLIAGARSGFADDAVESLDATSFGTSTQMGRSFPVKIRLTRYSTPEERQALIDAFTKGQNAGLAKALAKMKPVGRISLPGTVGYDIAYAIKIDTPTGRKVRFVTTRRILFGEAYNNTRSLQYNLSAGEIDIDTQDKNKSTGTLLPAAQLIINQDGELQMELYKNPWRLTNIIDWNRNKNSEKP